MNLTFDPLVISFITLTVAIFVLIAIVIHLHLKLKKFLVGSKVDNLNDIISNMNKTLKEFEIFKTELETYLTTVEKRVRKSAQAIYTVRFNPFKGTGGGGNQSFATAFLNENRDGVIVSSLYSREHVSIFSKPIKKGLSEYELSEEEKTAVTEAMKMLKL
ncbi:MAG TPA: DUF4446 family protein [Candidatus Paceibacterota bacterium]